MTIRTIKFIKRLSVAVCILSGLSFIQEVHALAANGFGSIRSGAYTLVLRLTVFSYAAIWFAALILKLRSAVLLTSIVLLLPAMMIGYKMIAVWFEQEEMIFRGSVTLCLGVSLALYKRFVWRWWLCNQPLFERNRSGALE
jgi:hypothetical protein